MPEQLMEQPEKKAADAHFQRARRSWRSRFASDYRHWVRRTFSRESYINSLKALLWVVPLSALIWSYAFNEQLQATNPITVNLALSQDADRVIRFADEHRTVIATLKGPQKDIGAIEDYLRANTLKLDVDRQLGPGQHQIDVRYALNHDRRVSAAGMTVDTCEPDRINVDVDTIVSRVVEVKLRPDEPKNRHATFTPAQVTLFAPKQQLEAVMPQYIYANPKSYEPYLKSPGVSNIPAVALEIPPGLDATTTPSTVHAEIEVIGTESTIELPPSSVLALTPAGGGAADHYLVKFDARLSGIKITGPKETIDKITSGDLEAPHACFLPVYQTPGVKQPASLKFVDMPPGVRLTDDKPLTIDYMIEER